MDYVDAVEEGDEVVRSFMLTKGRTRANARELPIETMVEAPAATRLNRASLPPERQQIADVLVTKLSIAEVSAMLDIPLRAAIVVVSEMVAEELLVAAELVDVVDEDLVSLVRLAIESL